MWNPGRTKLHLPDEIFWSDMDEVRVHRVGVELGIKYNVVGVCQEVVEHGVQPASPGTASIIPGDCDTKAQV